MWVKLSNNMVTSHCLQEQTQSKPIVFPFFFLSSLEPPSPYLYPYQPLKSTTQAFIRLYETSSSPLSPNSPTTTADYQLVAAIQAKLVFFSAATCIGEEQ